MIKQDEAKQHARSIEVLIAKLEEAADPALKSAAQELVRALMELHGAGLERILEIVRQAGEPASRLVERFQKDELVRSLLLLYGLHSQDLRTRVVEALEGTRGFLKSHGASAELASIEEGAITEHFRMQPDGCGSSAALVEARIGAAILDAAPEASSIVIEDKSAAKVTGLGFVPVSALQNRQAIAIPDAARDARSGD
jgi:Fe-S cluster biogenesis protein NfuA